MKDFFLGLKSLLSCFEFWLVMLFALNIWAGTGSFNLGVAAFVGAVIVVTQ